MTQEMSFDICFLLDCKKKLDRNRAALNKANRKYYYGQKHADITLKQKLYARRKRLDQIMLKEGAEAYSGACATPLFPLS